ncbi:DNA-binding transcriptional ArsR family regulator [Kerstersia similis]
MTISPREDLAQYEQTANLAVRSAAETPGRNAESGSRPGAAKGKSGSLAAKALCQFLDADAEQAAALLRAAGNPRRLLVLCLLIENEEMSVGSLLEHLDLSQSALSQHLARMREEGLVTYRRSSQTLYYRIDDERVRQLIAALKEIYSPQQA